MKNFLVITNKSKDSKLKIGTQILEYAKKHEDVKITLADVDRLEGKYKFTNPDKVSEDIECVIAVGGDGTLLQAARDLFEINVPFIGVNRGTLGYLSEVRPDQVDYMMDKLINDEYTIEKRMMIEGEVHKKGERFVTSISLNDIVISRIAGRLNLSVLVKNKFLTTYPADGVIISTPTGSTAYNLSAGGPIVDPQAEIIVITPMYPHTLNTRSVILSTNDEITIKINEIRGSSDKCGISFDGDFRIELGTGDKVKIRKSNDYTKIIKLSDQSFIEVLNEKMGDR